MTTVPRTGPDQRIRPDEDERPLSELLNEVVGDLQTLFHQELQLAKAEMREEATRAGKAAGLFGGAGFAGYMTLVLLSLAAVFGLAQLIGPAWSALVVAAVWAVIGAVLYMRGRSEMRRVSMTPERTVETLKEDAQWAKHPTR
ncbi:phage holin family protein [Streptomonospora sp. PA3]|uniref:phage holin family protein n=1 Tax=Streptomonospora sp. PA3 TaxID=2607326 RepID=UPI0012DEDDC0|nr:phage holin family protein [Streptomonospora sp. PA3]MUL43729.1 phage holin family protein [Streptomonospora sp. PA3]